MNIGIDIDDTISKTSEEMDIWGKKYTEEILKRKFELRSIDVLDPMWCKHLYGWEEKEDKKFFELFYEIVVQNVKPKEDAIETINELSKNNTIILITARWERNGGRIEKYTKEWLKRYNINYHKLFLNYEDKREIVRSNNIELFIDDNIQTCRQISEMGVKTYIMNSRLNQNIDTGNIERVYSWKEIAKKIKGEF